MSDTMTAGPVEVSQLYKRIQELEAKLAEAVDLLGKAASGGQLRHSTAENVAAFLRRIYRKGKADE